MKDNKNNWLIEYEEFISDNNSNLPQNVKENVFTKIHNLMNPNAFKVFFKILGIHLGVGFLSLSICHQFDVNPFNTQFSLSDYMMEWGGHYFCMFGCGVLFISLSLFLAGYLLSLEEIVALKRTRFLQILSLGLISLGLFVGFGADMAIGIAALWIMGVFVGGILATETIWRVKLA